jgi:integrase
MDLFDPPPDLTGSPLTAWLEMFEVWATTAPGKKGPLKRQSVAVYEDMWRSLCQWCVGQRVDLTAITSSELSRYLDSRAGSSGSRLQDRYAWRLLRLVERVAARHAQTHPGTTAHEAVERLLAQRPELRYANARQHDAAIDHLTPGEARALVDLLLSPERLHRWQDLRNRCAVALHLGAGITPLELRQLSLADLIGDPGGPRKLNVMANGTVRAHQTPMAPWAWRVLQRWLQLRDQLQVPGDALLPSTRTGKPWGKTNHDEAVRAVMKMAGLPPQGGAYRLRHTFCLRQLHRGRPPELVAQWLGIEPAAMTRYVELRQQTVEPV